MTAYAEYNFISYITKTTLSPSYSPYVALDKLKPTFLGRLENFLLHAVDSLYYSYFVFPELDRIVSSSFKNLPPLLELAERSILTMFNYDVAVDGMVLRQCKFYVAIIDVFFIKKVFDNYHLM